MMGGDDDDGDAIAETQEISSENLFQCVCAFEVKKCCVRVFFENCEPVISGMVDSNGYI